MCVCLYSYIGSARNSDWPPVYGSTTGGAADCGPAAGDVSDAAGSGDVHRPASRPVHSTARWVLQFLYMLNIWIEKVL